MTGDHRSRPSALLLAGLFVLSAALCAKGASVSAKELERTKLSVMLLVEGTLRGIEKKPVPSKAIERLINDNKIEHREKDASFDSARRVLKADANADLDRRLDQIFRASGLKAVDPAWCRRTESRARERGRRRIADHFANHFEQAFAEARRTVVDAQRAILLEAAVPQTEQDFLDLENDAAGLRERLTERSLALYREPIFSENVDFLAGKVEATVRDARRQRNEQRRIVQTSRGGGPKQITVDAIQAAIEGEIDRYRATLARPFGLFPSVKKAIPDRARALTLEKFVAWTDDHELAVPPKRLRQRIEADPVSHQQRLQSERRLAQSFLPEIRVAILDRYTKRLSAPEKQRLERFLAEQPSFLVALEAATARSLVHLEPVRAELSTEQFARIFPRLASGTWRLDEMAVARRYNRDRIKENQEIVQGFLAGKPVFEETQQLVAKAVERLASYGDAAIDQQMRLVEAYRQKAEGEIDRLLQPLSNSGTTGEATANRLVAIATETIRHSWSEAALAADYPELFPPVIDQIRKEIKDLLPVALQRQASVRQAERQKEATRGETQPRAPAAELAKGAARSDAQPKAQRPGAGSGPLRHGPNGSIDGKSDRGKANGPGGTGAAAQRKASRPASSMTIVIDITIERGKIVIVSVDIDSDDAFVFTFPLGRENRKRFQALTAPHLRRFEERIAAAVVDLPEGRGTAPIYCIVRVFHPRVPYGLVHDLRQRFKDAAITSAARKPRLYWYDGFIAASAGADLDRAKKRSHPLPTVPLAP